MTRDDIIRMAREAGVKTSLFVLDGKDSGYFCLFERFAAIVAAAERDACAKVADDGRFLHDDSPEAKFGKACAAAIRARGKND